MVKRKKRPVVADCIFADSEQDPDQRYLSGFSVPDPFLSLRIGRKSIGVFSDLEFNRAQKESRFTEILSLTAVDRSAKEWRDRRTVTVADQIAWLVNVYYIDILRLPQNFPVWVSEGLHKHKIDFQVVKGALFPARLEKTVIEAEMVREGNRCSAAGFHIVKQMLEASEIKEGLIYFEGKPLTSERLRQEIDVNCMRMGGVAMNTIVAGGDQACDAHCVGSGPLSANELIIVDIFPRMMNHGYFGDMTRTFLKGEASEEQRRLVSTVHEAQKMAISMVRANAQGRKIHRAIQALFDKEGYETKEVNGVPTGFFHGTGHGLGLEIHESIRIGNIKQTLRPGFVVTIEPGLYYPGLGGCRIEDVLWVTKDGCEMLSSAPYDWEIP
ncbi:aminopeptidase P family protein [Opitutia bacterium ISCC 51]|nr:aminopeptidase P family protein [Opitutae bacterium ISCC 51]QXD28727.1 aminopeptidase P family protein [Opitutae bacterium ISCC 52]